MLPASWGVVDEEGELESDLLVAEGSLHLLLRPHLVNVPVLPVGLPVCGMDPVRVSAKSFILNFLNSLSSAGKEMKPLADTYLYS